MAAAPPAADSLPTPRPAPQRTRSEVVGNFAEIANGECVKNHQVFGLDIVDLVLGVSWNEQQPSWFDRMHHAFNRDGSAPAEGEIGLRLCVAVGFEGFTLLKPDNAHGHVVVAPRMATEQLFPLRHAARGPLVWRPLRPFKRVKVCGVGLHRKVARVRKVR